MQQAIIEFVEDIKNDFDYNYKFSYDRFFKEPGSKDIDTFGDTIKSSLYMLRLDINHCMENQNGRIAVWASTSLILTGIDLLSQYYTGIIPNEMLSDPTISKMDNGQRFTKYCKENKISAMTISDDEKVSPLYKFRNSFLHGYSLRTASKTGVTRYFFDVDYKRSRYGDVILRMSDDKDNKIYRFYIDLFYLYRAFNNSISEFKQKLGKDEDLRKNFVNVSNYYSFIIPPDLYQYKFDDEHPQTMTGLDPATMKGTTSSASSLSISY